MRCMLFCPKWVYNGVERKTNEPVKDSSDYMVMSIQSIWGILKKEQLILLGKLEGVISEVFGLSLEGIEVCQDNRTFQWEETTCAKSSCENGVQGCKGQEEWPESLWIVLGFFLKCWYFCLYIMGIDWACRWMEVEKLCVWHTFSGDSKSVEAEWRKSGDWGQSSFKSLWEVKDISIGAKKKKINLKDTRVRDRQIVRSKGRKEVCVIQKFCSLGNCWYDLTWEIEEEQICAGKVE